MALPRVAHVATISTAVITTAMTTYALIVYNRVSKIDAKHITAFNDVPDSFRDSATMRKIINPKHHSTVSDTRFMTLDIPASQRHISDEALLARFIKEFYTGWVFAPERWLLRLLRKDLVGFPAVASYPVPTREWNASALPDQKLLPLHSIILGGWQVVDANLVKPDEAQDHSESSIDLAYGSGTWKFAGSNRFSIQRLKGNDDDQGPTQVRLTYASSNCNPLHDKWPFPGFMKGFHNIYAMLLYREAMGGVKSWLEEPSQPQLTH